MLDAPPNFALNLELSDMRNRVCAAKRTVSGFEKRERI